MEQVLFKMEEVLFKELQSKIDNFRKKTNSEGWVLLQRKVEFWVVLSLLKINRTIIVVESQQGLTDGSSLVCLYPVISVSGPPDPLGSVSRIK